MDSLKDTYFSRQILLEIGSDLSSVYPALPIKKFNQAVTKDLPSLELMQRLDQLVQACGNYLPHHFPTALNVLYDYSQQLTGSAFNNVFLSQFVAQYGLGHRRHSLQALADFTQYATSEFAVRHFIKQDLADTLKVMRRWAESENFHVRRLASEGCRPHLPWSFHLTELVTDPSPAWPILRTLQTDPEKYVQKSVANHLNDISKNHSDLLMRELKQWDCAEPITAWIVRQGCRTLIKQGHPNTLALLGYTTKPQFTIKALSLSSKSIRVGEQLTLCFDLVSTASKNQTLVVDYKIYYQKNSGRLSSKVFKLKSITLEPKQKMSFEKTHSFALRTTRKLYAGEHQISILVNGIESKALTFELRVH